MEERWVIVATLLAWVFSAGMVYAKIRELSKSVDRLWDQAEEERKEYGELEDRLLAEVDKRLSDIERRFAERFLDMKSDLNRTRDSVSRLREDLRRD